MRSRILAIVAAAVLFVPVSGSPARATEVLVGGNVTYVGHIPEVTSVSGRIQVFDTSRGRIPVLVTNNHRGISTYDVSIPEAPVLLSHLPLPHFYNEDLEFGGNILLTGTDPSWVDWRSNGDLGGLYIVDLSNVENLRLHYTNVLTGNRWIEPAQKGNGAGHTVSCIRADCSWAYVNGSGTVVVADLTNPAAPRVAGTFSSPVGSTHDIQVDDAGIAWMVGSGGIVGLNTSNPASPSVVTDVSRSTLQYHHNSLRPNATQFVPRTDAEFGDPAVRPGELLSITEEAVWPVLDQTACNGQGRFQTRWLRDRDAVGSGLRSTITTLDTWETELQVAGIAAKGIGMCSAHYFAQQDNLVAIAWYEQGVRILDISDPRNIQQVGYFIAPGANAWSTVWAGEAAFLNGQVVYAFDETSGIDILLVGDGTAPVQAPILPEWSRAEADGAAAVPHKTWSFGCRLPAVVK